MIGSSLFSLFSQFVVYLSLSSNLYYYPRLQPRAGLIPLFPVLNGKLPFFRVADITSPNPRRVESRGEEKRGRRKEGRGREKRGGEQSR